MKKFNIPSYAYFLIFLLLFNCSPGFGSAIPIDGTWYLRSKKKQLDKAFENKYLLDKNFRKTLQKKALSSSEMRASFTKTSFQVFNFKTGAYEHRYGTLIEKGKHCYIFVDSSISQDYVSDCTTIKNTFDNTVYPEVTSWFGKPIIPKIFSLPDDKIYIFLTDISDKFTNGYVAGYFDHRDLEGLWGNQKLIFFMDIYPGKPGDPNDKSNPFYRTLAHEFQHMINFSYHLAQGLINEKRWLDEGMAMFSEYLFSGAVGNNSKCIPPTPHLDRFLEKPQINLIASDNASWFSEGTLFRHYGASFLFVWYLVEKYGGNSIAEKKQFTQKLIKSTRYGTEAIDDLLSEQNSSFSDAFMNWICMLYLDTNTAKSAIWSLNKTDTTFSLESKNLPIKAITHSYIKEKSSFLGGEGQIPPNSLNAEMISGTSTVQISFTGEPGLTPFIAYVKKDKTRFLQKIVLNASNTANFTLNLSDADKFLIAPVVINGRDSSHKAYSYSYHAKTDGLLLYPIQSPVFSDQFTIVLKSFSGPITATPSLNISFNNLIDSPKFYPLANDKSIYVAEYRIPGTGKGQAIVYYGPDSCSFSFSAAALSSSTRASVTNGNFSLNVPPCSNYNGKIIVSEALSSNILPDYRTISRSYNLIANDSSLHNAQITYKSSKIPEKGVGFINIKDGKCSKWFNTKYQNGCYVANIDKKGIYQLVCDNKSPVVSNLKSNELNNTTIINFTAIDNLSGIDFDNSKVLVDNNNKNFTWKENGTNNYSIFLENLSAGNHNISLNIKDFANNNRQMTLAATISQPASLIKAIPVPNPCKYSTSVKVELNGSIASVSSSYGVIKIYDSSGNHISSLPLTYEGQNRLSANWNCKTKDNKGVSNGIYFFKAKVNTGNKVLKTNGKIAVLK